MEVDPLNIRFTVAGEPCGKGRPIFSRHGNSVVTRTPPKTAEYEKRVKLSYLAATERYCFPKGVPLRIKITAHYLIPPSATKANKALMGANKMKPVKVPDWDNIGKIICDSLNGLAYHDDAQIVEGTVIKRYASGTEPMVEVEISEVTND